MKKESLGCKSQESNPSLSGSGERGVCTVGEKTEQPSHKDGGAPEPQKLLEPETQSHHWASLPLSCLFLLLSHAGLTVSRGPLSASDSHPLQCQPQEGMQSPERAVSVGLERRRGGETHGEVAQEGFG